MESIIAEAMFRNDLSVAPSESDMIFIGDAQAVLMSEGRNMCLSYGCNVASSSGEDNLYTDRDRTSGIYYIRCVKISRSLSYNSSL